MALQIRRGTNAERILVTPAPGELVYVTDYLTAPPGTNAVYVGDGATLGGVPLSSGATLGGPLAANISLNSYQINGTGSISITGNISNTGSLTVTGNIIGTGNISRTGDLSLVGNATITGSITGSAFTGDVTGSVFADDSSGPLVNAIDSSFSGSRLTLTEGTATTVISGNMLDFEDTSDSHIPFMIGSEDTRLGVTINARRTTTISALQSDVPGLDSAGTILFNLFRGSASVPVDINEGDIGGTVSLISYSGGAFKFSGQYGFILEDQTGAPTGTAPATFLIGGAASAADFDLGNYETSRTALKFYSDGTLYVPLMLLNNYTNAEEAAIPALAGMMIFNTDTGKFRGYNGTSWVDLS